MQPHTETIRQYDIHAREWRTVTVPAAPMPRAHNRARTRQPGRPVDYTGLSAGSPLPMLADTAFAPGESLADMRTYVKPATMRTHRAIVTAPGEDMGHYSAPTARERCASF